MTEPKDIIPLRMRLKLFKATSPDMANWERLIVAEDEEEVRKVIDSVYLSIYTTYNVEYLGFDNIISVVTEE